MTEEHEPSRAPGLMSPMQLGPIMRIPAGRAIPRISSWSAAPSSSASANPVVMMTLQPTPAAAQSASAAGNGGAATRGSRHQPGRVHRRGADRCMAAYLAAAQIDRDDPALRTRDARGNEEIGDAATEFPRSSEAPNTAAARGCRICRIDRRGSVATAGFSSERSDKARRIA